ncbi:subclass B1 metallo-beta-lactamase [Thalassotalea sp. LPB0316]|uniref:subclass B1 metallo-beta-lactamase n=1 Tax=Thalassotalea sp. LPB0316 TaxID=2769490 RepID=UPI001868C701|nr:subclass B1 metallo-beta-lactamase [Thalassotalea sp. LPB0316]QOL24980.1 subclass B1 metallo-beta-lactamase [Thalassotalea sp. LPB0316]
MKFYVLLLLLFCVSSAKANDSKFNVTPIAENVYQHISFLEIEPWGLIGASGLVLVEGEDAYLIDTPWTNQDTQKLIAWVKSKGLNIKGAIVTHFHQDASGGLLALNNAKIKTYATSLTNKLLREQGREIANNEINSVTFEFAESALETFYPGAGHSRDNIVIWLPKQSILFGGCFVKSLTSKSLGNIADASVNEWPNSIHKILNKYPTIQWVVPGHGKVGGVELLEHTEQLVIDKIGR